MVLIIETTKQVLQKNKAIAMKKMALMAIIVALLDEVVEALGSGLALFLSSS